MVVAGWLVTRLVMLGVLVLFERFVVGDVFYYHGKIAQLFDVGPGRHPQRVPDAGGVDPLAAVRRHRRLGDRLPGRLHGLHGAAGRRVHVRPLPNGGRSGGRRHDVAIDFWLLFVLLIGPLCYLRFDMLPAVLAGGALLAARRRPWVTGALTGLGAAVKLWPALLIAAFCAHRPDRKVAGWAFVIVGFGLAGISLLLGGWTRLLSPLTWQSGRGLQIESIWATPLMVARAWSPSDWRVDYSRFQAYEIFGPGVSTWLLISNVATVAGLVVLIALWVRAYRARDPSPVAVGLIVLATVAIMTVTNKTLSPQYLLWLGGPMAALLLLRHSAIRS